ncbi:MAG: hypothetical protein H0X29_00040 [Parachlamydiaceae bacterium]|nr:hypothetical protein [Parachlamydiaceae bacterium]
MDPLSALLIPDSFTSSMTPTHKHKKPSPLEEKTSSIFYDAVARPTRTFRHSRVTDQPFKKKSRKILPFGSNLTPSVQLDLLAKEKNLLNPELAKQHAFLRIQIFYLEAIALQGLGTRSDGTLEKDLHVTASHARKQGGKGSKGTHAAHANTIGGLADNKRELVLSEIVNENKLTPRKRKILNEVARGAKEEDFELLISPNKDIVIKTFNRIWRKNSSEESLFEGSRFNDTANSTNELPGALNMQCDCLLEQAIRPQAEELIKSVMFNQMTAEEATIIYLNKIKEHFENILPKIADCIDEMKNYKTDLINFFQTEAINDLKLSILDDFGLTLKKIMKFELTIIPTQSWQKGTRERSLKNNFDFLKFMQEQLVTGIIIKDDLSDSMKKKLLPALQEISKKIEILDNLDKYCFLELCGTDLPNFAMLAGTYDKENHKHVMFSPNRRESLQMSLIHTKTPTKKNIKKPEFRF